MSCRGDGVGEPGRVGVGALERPALRGLLHQALEDVQAQGVDHDEDEMGRLPGGWRGGGDRHRLLAGGEGGQRGEPRGDGRGGEPSAADPWPAKPHQPGRRQSRQHDRGVGGEGSGFLRKAEVDHYAVLRLGHAPRHRPSSPVQSQGGGNQLVRPEIQK